MYVLDFDTVTGALSGLECIAGPENPAYLVVSADGRSLQVAWEVPEWPEGLISSYAIDPNTGRLSYVTVHGSSGVGPSYLSCDSKVRFCFASNYVSGEVVMLPIRDDGGLGDAVSIITQSGQGPNLDRQAGPHPHCMVLAPDDRFVFSADLGADTVFGYEIDYATPQLTPHHDLPVPPGSGPRHLVFHPCGQAAYLSYELTSKIAVLAYTPDRGQLQLLEEHSTLPPGFSGASDGADVQVHPSGRWVYVSNRGHDSVAVFAVGDQGRLDSVGWRGTEGVTPRSFAISPDGGFLLVANQDSDNIVVLSIDQESGLPIETVSVIEVPTPSCVKLAPDAFNPAL